MKPQRAPAGIVNKVNKEGGYVFIRRYYSLRLEPNDILESRGEGRTANLYPTGETLGEHIAADIRSGTVEIGDAVYIHRDQPVQDQPQ
ncbi:MAG: hypothetical protein ACSHX0_10640 [Akkermansiaceae bacterium]